MRYIRYKKEKQQINFLNCAKPNKWIDTCQYREGDFEDVCSERCDCDTIVSPNMEGILVYEWSGDESSINLNYKRYDVTKNPYGTTLNKLGIDELTNCSSTFSNSNITKLRCFPDTSNVTTMYGMFSNCSGLTSLDLSNFNTSAVTDMSAMFDTCRSLTSLDLSSFNTSNVTDMHNMFNWCTNLTSLDLSHFDTSKVTNMSSMFYMWRGAPELDLSNFNTSNVTNMYLMFYQCMDLEILNISNWNTSNVTNMGYMFDGCPNLRTIYMRNCNTTTKTMIETALTEASIRDNVTIIT